MRILLLFCYFLLISSVFGGEFSFGSLTKHGFDGIYLKGLKTFRVNSKEYRLELKKSDFTPSELFLDFENNNPSDLQDKNGKYKVLESNYSVVESENRMGKRYASFSAKNSFISIDPNHHLLGSSSITETFYISFFLIPGVLEKNSNLISKSYITMGKKFGLECNVINNHIEVYFQNLFHFGKGFSKSFLLKSSDKLPSGEWTHVVITINPTDGKVELFENGIRKDSFLAVKSTYDSTVLSFGFHSNDTSPFYIGKNFYGKMDNFFVGEGEPDFEFLTIPYKKVKYDPIAATASQYLGEALSPVLRTKYSNALPIHLQYSVEQPEGTHYEILYRFSDTIFAEDSKEPVWKKAERFEEEERPRFQYYQWKAILRSDYSGRFTPSLKSVQLKYLESKPPDPPTGLRITRKKTYRDELKVCLAWNSNHEDEVKEGGGYVIHYGINPDRMVASIYMDAGGNKITGLQEGRNLDNEYTALTFCIDNDTIYRNAELQADRNLLTFKRGISYYFKVSSYNRFFNFQRKLGQDQKSKPSKPVIYTFPSYVSEE
ncbi:MAG: hypothetical protein H7A25_12590 [Leptospiraceae bacterium]|nr:hypothetical protein [Leptospiraceae bacterium]